MPRTWGALCVSSAPPHARAHAVPVRAGKQTRPSTPPLIAPSWSSAGGTSRVFEKTPTCPLQILVSVRAAVDSKLASQHSLTPASLSQPALLSASNCQRLLPPAAGMALSSTAAAATATGLSASATAFVFLLLLTESLSESGLLRVLVLELWRRATSDVSAWHFVPGRCSRTRWMECTPCETRRAGRRRRRRWKKCFRQRRRLEPRLVELRGAVAACQLCLSTAPPTTRGCSELLRRCNQLAAMELWAAELDAELRQLRPRAPSPPTPPAPPSAPPPTTARPSGVRRMLCAAARAPTWLSVATPRAAAGMLVVLLGLLLVAVGARPGEIPPTGPLPPTGVTGSTMFVLLPTHTTVSIRAGGADTIAHIKSLVHARTGMPPESQRLVHGAEMSVGVARDYGAGNLSTLHLHDRRCALEGGVGGAKRGCDYATKASGQDDCECSVAGGCKSAQKAFSGVVPRAPFVFVRPSKQYKGASLAGAKKFIRSLIGVSTDKDHARTLQKWTYKVRTTMKLSRAKEAATKRGLSLHAHLAAELMSLLGAGSGLETVCTCLQPANVSSDAHSELCVHHWAPAAGNITEPTTENGRDVRS